jgi:GAF domain-containing protein
MEMSEPVRSRIETVNRVLKTQRTLPAKLEALAEMLERTIERCDSVSIALVIEGRISTAASSSQLAVEADLVQYDHHEGPCLTSVAQTSTIRIDLLAQDERFEHFAPGAIEVGVESVLSIPLIHRQDVVGSINIYSSIENAFDDATERAVQPTASYAAELIGTSPLYVYSLDLVDQLVITVKDRQAIALAIGYLLAEENTDETRAWQLLGDLARDTDQTLGEVAKAVIERAEQGSSQNADGSAS